MVNTLNDASMYLSMDNIDLTSNSPVDLSGNGNNGTASNCSIGEVGVINECLGFNGSSSKVTVAHDASITPTTFSISFWYNANSVATTGYLIFKDQSGNNNHDFLINVYATTGLLNIQLQNGSSQDNLVFTPSVTTGAWHHVVFTSNGSTDHRLYVDGNLEDTSVLSWTINGNTQPFYVGSWNGSTVFNGLIDEVGIWSRVLTTTEVTALYNSGAGFNPYKNLNDAEAYYTMDDAQVSGTTLSDVSGNSNDATITGATTGATGVLNEGFNFTSVGDYVTTPAITLGTTSSIGGWFYKTNTTNASVFSTNAGGQRIQMYFSSTNFIAYTEGDTSITFAYSINTWYHWVLTFDGTNKRLYVNGILIDTQACTTNFASNTYYIGRLGDGVTTYDFTGNIDETAIYLRTLSPYEITTLYNNGSAYNPYLGLANAELYYSLDDADLTGSNPDDLSGNGNDGTNNGATTGAAGIVNQGFSFVTNDWISAPVYQTPTPQTINFWLKLDTIAAGTYLFDTGGSSNSTEGMFLYPQNNGKIQIWISPGGSIIPYKSADVGPNLGTTDWHMLTVTWDGTTGTGSLKYYVDSVLEATLTPTHTWTGNSSRTIAWMAYYASLYGVDGSGDEFSLYNRILSPLEIEALYNDGSGFNPYDVVSPGYSNTVNGVITPSKINGIEVANISKFNGVE